MPRVIFGPAIIVGHRKCNGKLHILHFKMKNTFVQIVCSVFFIFFLEYSRAFNCRGVCFFFFLNGIGFLVSLATFWLKYQENWLFNLAELSIAHKWNTNILVLFKKKKKLNFIPTNTFRRNPQP